MIGAGADKITIFPGLQKMIDSKGDYGCPKDDAECRPATQGSAEASAAANELNTAEKQELLARFGVYTTLQSSQGECRILTKSDTTKNAWKACFSKSAKGKREAEGGSDIPWLTETGMEFISNPEFEMRIGALIAKNMIGKAQACALNATLFPAGFKVFLDSIKDSNPDLYRACLRLYFQAMEQAKVSGMEDEDAAKEASGLIAADIITWAKGMNAALESGDNAIADVAKKELPLTFVQGAKAENSYKIAYGVLPDALLVADALGMTPAIAGDPKVQAELYRLFYEALMSFRAQKGQGEDIDDIAAKVAKAVKDKIAAKEIEAESPRGMVAKLAQFSAVAGLDKSGALEKVALSPRTLGTVPQILRDRVLENAGLEERVYLEQALLDFWNKDVGAKKNAAGITYGKVYDGLKDADQDKVANTLADKFIGFSPDFVERANMIALTRVAKLDADGTVETSSPNRLLYKDFAATWESIGFRRHLRDLSDQYKKQAADAKLQLTDRDIAKELARQTKLALARPEDFADHQLDIPLEASSKETPSDAALKNWLGMSAGGFDSKGTMKPLETVSENLPGLEFSIVNKAAVSLEKDASFSNRAQADLRYEHAFSNGIILGAYGAVDLGTGLNPIFTPEAALLYPTAGNSFYFNLDAAHGIAGYAFNKNHKILASLGLFSDNYFESQAGGLLSYRGMIEKFDLKLGLDIGVGKIANTNTVDARKETQFEMGERAYDFRASGELGLHKDSKSAAGGDMSVVVSSDDTCHLGGKFFLKSAPTVDGVHRFPLLAEIFGATSLNDDSSWTRYHFRLAYRNLFGGEKKYAGAYVDLTYHDNSDYMFQAKIDDASALMPGDSGNTLRVKSPEDWLKATAGAEVGYGWFTASLGAGLLTAPNAGVITPLVEIMLGASY